MFPEPKNGSSKYHLLSIIGLSLLSASALSVTIWTMVDLISEQALVEQLIRDLPENSKASARSLSGELKLQSRLTVLVLLNVVVTAIALILVWRAYRASQTSLRDFKAIASDVLSGMQQGVITTDIDGIITSINPRGLDLLKTNERCVDKPIAKLASVALEEYRNHWLQNQRKHPSRDFVVHEKGVEKKLHVVAQMLKDRDGNEVGNVFQIHDVTEQSLIEDRMRRMERYIGLGSLVGGLHHEIKNPLAALSLHVQLLEEDIKTVNDSADVQQTINIIGTEVKRIGDVLDSFRNFATHDALHLQDVDLISMIRQQVDLMRPQVQNQNIKLEFTPKVKTLPLQADQVRLEQVFLNLIVNAMEAMPNGGTLKISTSEDDDTASVKFSDSGHGVPENLQSKIFDPYFTNKSGGTGLGLAVCDKIVRQHFGTLEFDTSNSGTTFTVKLLKEQQALAVMG